MEIGSTEVRSATKALHMSVFSVDEICADPELKLPFGQKLDS
jgi:hypothetical protein